jgi:hypothetical protein
MGSNRFRTELFDLRRLLASRTDEAAAEALQAGEVSASRMDELTRLERLVRMRELTQGSVRSRWAVPAVAVVTLVVASFLLFTHVRSTPVELDLLVSEIGFVVPKSQPLSNPIGATSVRVSGLTAIQMPDDNRRLASFVVATTSHASPGGTIDVNPLTVPAGTSVLLRPGEHPRTYALVITPTVSNLALSVNGSVQFAGSQGFRETRAFAWPRRVELEPDAEEVRLDVTLSGSKDPALPLWTPMPVQDLSLSSFDRFETPDRPLVREVSTIRSGTVFFEALPGRTHALRVGEELQFRRSSGEVREWRLGDSGIGIRFRGTVAGLTTGPEGARRTLMPTRLEFWRAQHGVTLLWGTTAYVVGVFITVLGWWKRQL